MSKLRLSLTKPQADFLELQKKCLYALFTGGYGSGKSHVLSIAAFLDALHSPNAVIGIYEPNYALVRDVAMNYIQSLLDQHHIKYTVNKNESKITTESNQIGNFRFFSMDNPDSLVGYETYTAHVDEIDTIDQDKADRLWNMIIARTRQWPKDLPEAYLTYNETSQRLEPRNKVCAYSTPEGFKFTYKTWGKSKNEQYQFLQARTDQNPFVPQAYIDNLRAKYDGPLIDAYLEGKWVNLTSGSVYYAYDAKMHNSTETIRPGESLHIGMDFNVGNMCASIFVPRKGGQEWHQVAEIHGLLDVPDIIQYIHEKWQSKGHTINVYPDASSRHRAAQNASDTTLKQLQAAGFRVVKNNLKNPQVVDRVACVNNAFAKSKLFVNALECPNQVECLTQQAYDKMGKPEKGTGFDDTNDAFGYFVFKRLNLRNQLQVLDFSFAQRV